MQVSTNRHMTLDIRSQIYILKKSNFSLREIAKKINYSPAAISKEIKRNSGERGYRYQQADEFRKNRISEARKKPTKLTAKNRSIIINLLEKKWSPEQISGRLKKENTLNISTETIYQLIRADKKSGGSLYKKLRHKGKKYNKRVSKDAGRGCIPNRVGIEKRPKIVDKKKRIGDFEGDTIIGKNHKGAIVSYVERKTKFCILSKVNKKTAKNIVEVTLKRFKELPFPILTITYDNGKEFSSHEQIAEALNTECYFARSYRSSDRGLNEHTNGLVREYIPKSSEFSKVCHKTLQEIEDALNDRPRKVLNFMTPREALYLKEIKNLTNIML